MIKIIKGVYGYWNEQKKRVQPKTVNDAPFELAAEQEARLVGLGVAEYVGTPAAAVEETVEEVTGYLDSEQLERMTVAELREIAEKMGLDTSKMRKKADIVEAIAHEEVTAGEIVEDGDELPTFDAAEAVEE